MRTVTPFADSSVAAKFAAYAQPVRDKLLALRELIFATARANPEIGPLTETLKWGQPSYLTEQTKSGSTIRLDALPVHDGGYALFFHCQTDLVETFRTKFGSQFRTQGNRALLFQADEPPPLPELRECVNLALTYHLRKRVHRLPIGQRIQRSTR